MFGFGKKDNSHHNNPYSSIQESNGSSEGNSSNPLSGSFLRGASRNIERAMHGHNEGGVPPPAYASGPGSVRSKGRAGSFKVTQVPTNDLVFSNCIIGCPSDFSNGENILINDFYAFTIKTHSGVEPGCLGVSNIMRIWAGLSLEESVRVSIYSDNLKKYINIMEVEVDYLSANRASTQSIDTIKLSKLLITNFQNQIFAPTQLFLMEYNGYRLKLKVKSLRIYDLDEKSESSIIAATTPEVRGIITSATKFQFTPAPNSVVKLKGSGTSGGISGSSSSLDNSPLLDPKFNIESLGIGGLDKEFSTILRRVFIPRIIPKEARAKVNLPYTKGLLLYGPPGTGKTLIASRIGKMLNSREPKIVNGPSILSKYVGQSEENLRNLFAEAEKEFKAKGDDSELHVIIFDEMDALFKSRGSTGGDTGVGDSVVNQLLAKMDGVNQLNNILIIGMTNRIDLIDSALLRPGRFEVQLKISLPDTKGRLQILQIHTATMRQTNTLASDVDLNEIARVTKNFTGAELFGLVKDATTFAYMPLINSQAKQKDIINVKVNMKDFLDAIDECKPMFGSDEKAMEKYVGYGIVKYSSHIDALVEEGKYEIMKVQNSHLQSAILIHGPMGSGKTALAVNLVLNSGFPHAKIITPVDYVNCTEYSKISKLSQEFKNCYESDLSALIIDDIEKIFDYAPIGPRFSNTVLQTLTALIANIPPENKRLLIIATTSNRSILSHLNILNLFSKELAVPAIMNLEELDTLIRGIKFTDCSMFNNSIPLIREFTGTEEVGIGVKKVISNLLSAKYSDKPVEYFAELMSSTIASRDL